MLVDRFKMSKVLKNIFSVFISKMFVQLFSVALLYYLTREFSPNEMAILPAFEMISGFAAMFFGFGVYPTLIKLIPAYLIHSNNRAMAIAKTSIYLCFFNAIVVSITSFIISDKISYWVFNSLDLSFVIELFSVGIFAGIITNLNNYLLMAFDRFSKMSILNMVQGIVRVIVIFALSLKWGFVGFVYGIVLSAIIGMLFSFVYVFDIYLFRIKPYSLTSYLTESWGFYLESFLMYFRREGDNLIITTFLTPEHLSIYYIAKKMYNIISSFFNSLDTVLTTQLSKFRERLEEYKSKVKELRRIYVLSMLPASVFLTAMSPFLIEFVAGANYLEARLIGVVLTLIPLLRYYFAFSFTRAIFLFLPSYKRFILTLINTIVLLTLSIVLTYYFELIGIALALFVTIILIGVVAFYMVKIELYCMSLYPNDSMTLLVLSTLSTVPLVYSYMVAPRNFVMIVLSSLFGGVLYLVLLKYVRNSLYKESLLAINTLLGVKVSV